MMTSNAIDALKQLLASPKKITIVPHRNPDGDAMGSTLGLYHFLLQQQHDVVVISPNEFPDFLAWLPGSEKVMIFEKDIQNCTERINQSDIIFTLDFNALHRVGEQMQKALEAVSTTFVMIDHHQLPDSYAQFTYSDTKMGFDLRNGVPLHSSAWWRKFNRQNCCYLHLYRNCNGFRLVPISFDNKYYSQSCG